MSGVMEKYEVQKNFTKAAWFAGSLFISTTRGTPFASKKLFKPSGDKSCNSNFHQHTRVRFNAIWIKSGGGKISCIGRDNKNSHSHH
jgi:hypothetical protein